MTPSQFFDALITAVKGNFIIDAGPGAIAFLQGMAKAPPATNPVQFQLYLAAQVATLNSTWAIALPNAVQADQAQIANSLAAEVQAALNASQAATAAAAAVPAKTS